MKSSVRTLLKQGDSNKKSMLNVAKHVNNNLAIKHTSDLQKTKLLYHKKREGSYCLRSALQFLFCCCTSRGDEMWR